MSEQVQRVIDANVRAFEEQIQKKVSEAQRALVLAPSVEDLAKTIERINLLQEQHMRGEVSGAEFVQKMRPLAKIPGTIQFDTIVEMRECLRRLDLVEKSEVDRMVAHENDHLNKANMHGLSGTLQIQFAKQLVGDKFVVKVQPATAVAFPKQMPPGERNRLAAEIYDAPEELSPHDERHLKN